jgi:hypothetical protein
MNISNSHQNVKLSRLKGIIFPFLAAFLLIIYIIIPSWRDQLWGTQVYYQIGLPLITAPILLITLANFFSKTWLKILIIQRKIDLSKTAFNQAIQQRNYYGLFFVFPLTMLFEELVFRGFFFSLLSFKSIFPLSWIIICNALLFSLYHFHIYLQTKNIPLTEIFIVFSFLLGLFLAYIVPVVGILGCTIFHALIVICVYAEWYRLSKT